MKTICGSSCEIIEIAGEFCEAYHRCIENKNPRKDEFERTVTDVANVPAIVNGAFAIELYLKSMIDPSRIKRKRSHNIDELISFLDEQLRKEIIKKIKEELPKLIKPTNKTKIENKKEIIKETYTFEECLEGISNSFEYWRYIYEKENSGFGFYNILNIIPVFLRVIKEYAEKNKKRVDI